MAGLAGLTLAGACTASEPLPLGHQQIGTRIHLTPADMPAPYATGSAGNSARRIARPANARPRVPDGFTASIFADNFGSARWLHVLPNGDVLLAEADDGRITLLRDADGDGKAERRATFAEGLDEPHGMALVGDHVFVGELSQIRKIRYRPGHMGRGGEPEEVTKPGSLGSGFGHWTRILALSPDGKTLFASVGSIGNVDEEDPPRATIQAFAADGSGQRTYAGGLRNPVGMDFHPVTGQLYTVVNERDGYGDEMVPDYLSSVQDGGFYGWPYAYIGPNPDPEYGAAAPEKVKKTLVPEVLFRSHSAPLGLVFYDAKQFPESYRGDAFVALHGSWNAARPRGYMIARVPFDKNGKADGSYEIFSAGFWASGRRTASVWGRPAGLAVAKDGALLVADDVANLVWRIAYTGK